MWLKFFPIRGQSMRRCVFLLRLPRGRSRANPRSRRRHNTMGPTPYTTKPLRIPSPRKQGAASARLIAWLLVRQAKLGAADGIFHLGMARKTETRVAFRRLEHA